MKKLVTIFIAILYISVASGATVQIHYCMDKLVSLGLIKDSGKCSKCGMKESKTGCCKQVARQLKLDSDHKAADVSYQWIGAPAVTPPLYAATSVTPLLAFLTRGYPLTHAPPLIHTVPLFIQYCTYLI